MRLISELGTSKTEEDVKDAYIKALGLKKYTKGLIDIQTEEIWFEAKEAATPPVLMFAQLLFYVRDARKKGERIPPFLAVIDREKAAIMETAKALPILADRSIKWPKSASAVDKSVAAQAAPYIETHFVVFKIESHEQEFVTAVKAAIKAGKFVRTPITPDNLRQVCRLAWMCVRLRAASPAGATRSSTWNSCTCACDATPATRRDSSAALCSSRR